MEDLIIFLIVIIVSSLTVYAITNGNNSDIISIIRTIGILALSMMKLWIQRTWSAISKFNIKRNKSKQKVKRYESNRN